MRPDAQIRAIVSDLWDDVLDADLAPDREAEPLVMAQEPEPGPAVAAVKQMH